MARRKHDADVGPLGVWAYNTRDALDLSVEAVVAALPTHYHPATLRKVEGGSAQPGSRMWRELGNFYVRVAEERQVPIDTQPRLRPEPTTATETPDPLVAAIMAQTEAINALVRELALSRAAQVEATEVAFRALGALVAPPDPPGTPHETEPEAHAGTGR